MHTKSVIAPDNNDTPSTLNQDGGGKLATSGGPDTKTIALIEYMIVKTMSFFSHFNSY